MTHAHALGAAGALRFDPRGTLAHHEPPFQFHSAFRGLRPTLRGVAPLLTPLLPSVQNVVSAAWIRTGAHRPHAEYVRRVSTVNQPPEAYLRIVVPPGRKQHQSQKKAMGQDKDKIEGGIEGSKDGKMTIGFEE